ncbi:MAG: vitamin K epoxide reductase family protein [bacterium]
MKNKTIVWKWISYLSFVGILLATYLFYSFLTQPQFSPCTISATVNCDAIISGPLSLILGIPSALYGLIGYIVIFIGSLLKRPKLVFGVATFGLLFCLYLGYRELFQLNVVCPVCIACLLVMVSVFFLSLKVNKK